MAIKRNKGYPSRSSRPPSHIQTSYAAYFELLHYFLIQLFLILRYVAHYTWFVFLIIFQIASGRCLWFVQLLQPAALSEKYFFIFAFSPNTHRNSRLSFEMIPVFYASVSYVSFNRCDTSFTFEIYRIFRITKHENIDWMFRKLFSLVYWHFR